MKSLKIGTRLSLCMLLFVMPLATLLYFYIGEMSKQIEFAEQEKRGNAFMRPVVKALDKIEDAYTDTLKLTAGDHEAEADLKATITQINQIMTEIQVSFDHYKGPLLFSEADLKSRSHSELSFPLINAKWQAIASADARNVKLEQYDSLVTDMLALIAYVSQSSNLILDPDLDSYSIMDALSVPLPTTIARIGDSERHAEGMLKGIKGASIEDEAKLETFATMMAQDDIGRLDADMLTLYNEDPNFYGVSPTLKPNTESKLATYDTASKAYVKALDDIIKNQSVTTAQLLAMSDTVGKASYAFWVAGADELDILLQTRIDYFSGERLQVLVMFAISVLFAFGAYWYVTHGIKTSLKKLQNAMMEIADGHLDYAVPCLDLRDEIGEMARTLELFKETSVEAKRMGEEQLKEQQSKLDRQKNVDDLIQHFDKKVSGLLFEVSTAADGMKDAVTSMEGHSRSTSEKTNATMSVTRETSNNVSAVAAAAEELSAAINEISRQVSRSATVTQDAVNKTQDADVTVQQLSNSAQRIGEVVTLISGIAEQIDLLALNATIESARAGDAGKGFAVVATEVKNLASQTSKATDTIATQIAEVQKVVGNVVTALTKIRGAIEEVNSIASTIAAAVEEQGAATKEIAMNIQRTSDRVQEVATNVTEVGNMAVATNDNAKQVMNSVTSFNTQSQSLQQEIEGFLGNISRS